MISKLMIIKNKQFGIFLLLILLGCSNDQAIGARELKSNVVNYYKSEKNKEWSKTYQYRTPDFKKTVMISDYIEAMNRDSDGWELLEFKITNISRIKDKRFSVEMVFVENAPLSHIPENVRKLFPKESLGNSYKLTSEGNSIWENINGEWKCHDAVSRSHLTLNHALTE